MSAWGPRTAVKVILAEHEQLTTVIGGMLRFIDILDEGEKPPGLMIFRAMLYYIREYPEQVHHPKENRFLFTRLRARTHELDEIIDELELQHAQGDVRLRNLENALSRYELTGRAALPALRILVEEYAKFYANHRQLEEERILPVAQRVLTKEDRDEIDRVFCANRDLFKGVKLEEDLDKLFSMIIKTFPDLNC